MGDLREALQKYKVTTSIAPPITAKPAKAGGNGRDHPDPAHLRAFAAAHAEALWATFDTVTAA
jgi:hypothetical protein